MALRRDASAFVVVDPGTASEMQVPIDGKLIIGRECAGVSERHRLLVRDETVSRTHLEIRVDADGTRAWAVDLSSHGSQLNGVDMQPSMPVPLRGGDELTVGSMTLQFRAARGAG